MHPAKTETTKTKKVLIVEDEGDICLILNIMLQEKDMELDHVNSLASAMSYFRKEQPAVVILDNKLPDGWGVDFASYVKANYPDTKIIMITGFSDAVKDVALQNGVDSFIQKPFTRDQIYQSVQELAN
jgi:DNA-binding NtrC family response regulator